MTLRRLYLLWLRRWYAHQAEHYRVLADDYDQCRLDAVDELTRLDEPEREIFAVTPELERKIMGWLKR